MTYALVTGGTSGIGRAFVDELARRGHDLVIVARDQASLEVTADEIGNTHGVRVDTLVADLANPEDLERVTSFISNEQRAVEVVVNNAGFGLNSPLINPDLALQRTAMDVMAFAPLAISGVAAGRMVERGSGQIINVASVSAWIIKGNYSAIKRWLISFTQALADELSGSGVQATVVCPSWVKTQLHERAGVKRPSLPGFAWMRADQVATAALDGAAAGKVVVVPTRLWSIIAALLRHAPAGVPRRISSMLRRSRSTH